MKHQLVRFFTIFSLLTLLFGAVPAAPAGAEAHAVPLAASGDSLWAKSVGGTDFEYPAGIAADSNGNAYVTGSFRETADFDPGAGSVELTSAGQEDIFLLKMDGNGNYAWAKRIGSTGIDGAASIAADASNNIYVTGVFSGTVDFDPGAGAANLTSAGLRDIFVAKYDSDGNYIWAKRMGGGTNDSGLGLTVDAGGNVYTTGNYQGTADFDPGAGTANLTSVGNNNDVFVSKLDSNGNFVWAKSMGGTESDQGRGIAVSASGNVYTIGNFEGTADFDPGAGTANLTSAGADDVFISKLDNSGNFVWAKRIGGTDYEEGTAIAIDADENIYTTGKYELTVDFDPGAGTFNLTSAGGGGDIFISKLDSGGNFVWAKSTGGTDFERGESIVLDANNNVYVTGVFSGTVDFDPGAGTFNLTGPGGEVFISILDQNGDFITARRMGGASYDWGTAITLDAQDNILVTGGFYETADFDPELTSAGDADVFIVKLEKVVIPSFADVPLEHSAWQYIEAIYNAGITGGCTTTPLNYCPNNTVTRAQMAIFLLRGIHGSSYTPPAVGDGTGFNDVPTTHSAAAWIKQLAAEGITGGCGGGNYCPNNPVTRAQMAIFLLRAKYGDDYVPPAVGGSSGFNDVPAASSTAPWIKQLAAEGITGGCGNGNYCPNNPVTRAQMAIFLQRTFNLPLP
ncbi:MAG: S-layer homology domain-containing protein [Anaerolineales bacterium]|nr:MAG: S-layer homology domain-containing protein [Anaerolineales bacterium]